MAIETILLAVGPGDIDRLDRLAEETVDVAGPTGATVVLGHVFTKSEYEDAVSKLDFDRERDRVSADDVANRHASIRKLVNAFKNAEIRHNIRGAVGPHGEQIVELAKETDADRVIVGGRRRSPTGKAVFGSTAQEVMLSAPCPVTFVRSDTK
ncbi:universal stress protein [Natronocalculus amylovorans]|uniref:Universal stress protein n=1 Tax=Natronocalculus amylovorans TaxID=2917812 RepID=A0AAE3FVD6_9EURY|nr:universal stress protein [Natronocalculus amylovorans]MCL9815660.1 universal stress protein [Natronocalculus amylovorans]